MKDTVAPDDKKEPPIMTPEMLDKLNKLLVIEEKQKEAKRKYMRRILTEDRDKVNQYRRDLYRKKKEAQKQVESEN